MTVKKKRFSALEKLKVAMEAMKGEADSRQSAWMALHHAAGAVWRVLDNAAFPPDQDYTRAPPPTTISACVAVDGYYAYCLIKQTVDVVVDIKHVNALLDETLQMALNGIFYVEGHIGAYNAGGYSECNMIRGGWAIGIRCYPRGSDPCRSQLGWRYKQTADSARVKHILKRHFETVETYRYHPGSIRIRVVDPQFRGMNASERMDLLEAHLETLDEETQLQLIYDVLLYPGEINTCRYAADANNRFEEILP